MLLILWYRSMKCWRNIDIMKNINEINAKYNELCSAVDMVDWKLREFTKVFDPQIDNLYLTNEPMHDLLIKIGEMLEQLEQAENN